MRRLAILISAAALAACGTDNPPVIVGNTNPLGSVGGVILDAETEMGLMGVSVTLITGATKLTATTDADGLFNIVKVPSGPFIVQFSNTGYQGFEFASALNGSVGNFPVQNPVTTLGPFALIKTTGTFNVRLIDQNGVPVSGVTVVGRPQVRWIDYTSGTPSVRGTYQVTGMSGMDGIVSFMGLPDYTGLGTLGSLSGGFGSIDTLPIDVPPIKVMSSEAYSFLGGTFPFEVNHLGASGSPANGQVPTILLAGPNTVLSVLDSNVDYLRTVTAFSPQPTFGSVGTFIPTMGPITIAFNEAVDRTTIRAQLFNEDATPSNVAMMATANVNIVTITPMSALLAGQRYNLALHIDALSNPGIASSQREIDTTVPIFISPGASPMLKVTANSAKLDPADPLAMIFQFSEPVGIGSADGNGISCAVFYDSIHLNNGMPWPGQFSDMPMTCPTPGQDITHMTPAEPTNFPRTGFSSKWHVKFDATNNPECAPNTKVADNTCSVPAPQTVAHIIFNRQPAATTIKRADGTPVADSASLTVTIPAM